MKKPKTRLVILSNKKVEEADSHALILIALTRTKSITPKVCVTTVTILEDALSWPLNVSIRICYTMRKVSAIIATTKSLII